MTVSLLGLTKQELRQLAVDEKLPVYRGNQIADWIYRAGVIAFDEMTNLPKEIRIRLNQKYKIGRSKVVNVQQSGDGTVKLLLELNDRQRIETVGIPSASKYTCCISTQAGCPAGCVFCATGQSGFKRDLTSGEIIDQLFNIEYFLKNKYGNWSNEKRYVDNIVFMGMGEPLLNYDNTLKAIGIINTELGIGARHITISTVGVVPGIERLKDENMQFTLAISLHAPSDEMRRYLIPVARKWPLKMLLDACREYMEKSGRRITFEYCLIQDINDADEHAVRLVGLLADMNAHINIIPFNNVTGLPFRAPSAKRRESFISILKNSGLNVTQRMRYGSDIDAACGQLRLRQEIN